MNTNLKYGLFFLGGVALGALGAVAVSRGKLNIRPLATDLLSRDFEVKMETLYHRAPSKISTPEPHGCRKILPLSSRHCP